MARRIRNVSAIETSRAVTCLLRGWAPRARIILGAHFHPMSKPQRPRLLEVKVIALKPEWWEWQVCEGDAVIMSGFETSRLTAQIEADGSLFLFAFAIITHTAPQQRARESFVSNQVRTPHTAGL